MRLVREACLPHSFFFFLLEYGLLPIFSLLILIQAVVRKYFDEVPLVLGLKYKDFLLVEDLRVEQWVQLLLEGHCVLIILFDLRDTFGCDRVLFEVLLVDVGRV